MIREGQDSCYLGDSPMLNGNPATHNTLPSPKFHNRGENLFPACSSEEQASRTLPRFSAWLRILSTSSSLSLAWGTSCVRFTNERSRTRQKSNARSCRAMHVCADRSLAWLAKRCGQSKRLRRWLPSLAARFALLLTRYPANENHPPSQSSLSSPKSLPSALRRRAF